MRHKLPAKKPLIHITFGHPIHGYWNGGLKGGGTFHPQPRSDGTIEWGCWELNFWFRLPFGKSWKDAAIRARNKIYRACKVNCTTEVVWG